MATNSLLHGGKSRDKARERAVDNKLHELEQIHEFTNAQFLKHFAQVSELLELTAKDCCALHFKPKKVIPKIQQKKDLNYLSMY